MAKRPSRRSAATKAVAVERTGAGWILVHPPCVRECAEDLDEVRQIIAAEEYDVAVDELRWLVESCSENIEAHYLLGKIAAEVDADLPLARGHFGFAYQLGAKALARAGDPTPLPALHPANRPFYDAGRGLAWTLNEMGKQDLALEIIEHLLHCEPADTLGLRSWIDEIKTAGTPIIELGELILPPRAEDESS